MKPKVAVIRFPGSNCETESVEAVDRAGLEGDIVLWNESPAKLARYAAYFLPGGFSYQDRIRAGAVAARLPVMDLLVERGAAGAPILGICNGAQILVEAGLVPGPGTEVSIALAPNRLPHRSGYYTRWIFLGRGRAASRCAFTACLTEPIPMPTAHAEGRFTARSGEGRSRIEAHASLCYTDVGGAMASEFPALPNGSFAGTAGVSNEAGNVLALMPHPDRALRLAQVPDWLPGPWGDRRRARSADLESDGPGMAIFRALALALHEGART